MATTRRLVNTEDYPLPSTIKKESNEVLSSTPSSDYVSEFTLPETKPL